MVQRKIADAEAAGRHLASRLRAHIDANGTKISQITDRLGWSQAYWSKLVNGKSTTNNAEVYERVATAIDMPLPEFRAALEEARAEWYGIRRDEAVDPYAALSRKTGIPEEELRTAVGIWKMAKSTP